MEFDWAALIVDDYVKGRMTLSQFLDVVEATCERPVV